MEKSMTWGKHPRYANNQWIKLAYGSDKAEYRYRESLGFTLRTVPIGTHPNKNPYPTRKGFGLRLYHAAKAIRKLGRDPYADIYTRGFDNCFENNDGSAVVWALMHEATQEPDDDNPLTRGIQTMKTLAPPIWGRGDFFASLKIRKAAPPTVPIHLYRYTCRASIAGIFVRQGYF